MNASVCANQGAAATCDPDSEVTYSDGIALFDVDRSGLVIVGRGHALDVACQIINEGARDWRRPKRLQRQFLDSLPGRSRASSIAPVRRRGW